MTSRFLLRDIEHEEGRKTSAYRDSEGVLTIGVGHTGPDVHEGDVWSGPRIDVQLRQDVDRVMAGLDANLPWWHRVDDNRQDVMVQMGFQLGVAGVLKFKRTLTAIERGDYARAADCMMESAWAKQTPARATRMAAQMRSGQRAWAYTDGK